MSLKPLKITFCMPTLEKASQKRKETQKLSECKI